MKIQSFHVTVPTKNRCVNNCPCCVSRLHENCENDRIGVVSNIDDVKELVEGKYLVVEDYRKRMMFVKDNDCNFAVLTGTGEPIMNKNFLRFFGELNRSLPEPFYSIDFQTTGVMLNDENLKFLRNEVGVTSIALSLFDMFDSRKNFDTLRTSEKLYFDIDEMCKKIKSYGFNLRLSLMLTKTYINVTPEEFFKRIKELGANFATFKKLYKVEGETHSLSNKALEVNQWINENTSSDTYINELEDYVIEHGSALNILPFGATRYSVNGISTVVDRYCMGKRETPDEGFKFFILKEDCHLYSEWDDDGSIIF